MRVSGGIKNVLGKALIADNGFSIIKINNDSFVTFFARLMS
jgi:hypothetical protein